MIKAIYLQEIHNRSCTSSLSIHTSNYHFINSGLNKSSRTHLTRFQCYIHRTPFQPPVTKLFACFADCIQLSMRKCIFIRVSSIVTARNDLTFIYDHTANRYLFQSFRLLRLTDGFFHKTFLICHVFIPPVTLYPGNPPAFFLFDYSHPRMMCQFTVNPMHAYS